MEKIKQFVKQTTDKVKGFMAQGHNLLITQITMVAISFFLNIWGLLSLCNVIDLFHMSAFNYFDNIALIPRYVLIIINMAIGIELFCFWATTLKGTHKNVWLIVNCAYSTILTVPLLYTFLALFAAPSGTLLPMVDLIYAGKGGFGDISSVGLQYFVFVLGTIMSAVFLAVPIISCIGSVKKNNKLMAQQCNCDCGCGCNSENNSNVNKCDCNCDNASEKNATDDKCNCDSDSKNNTTKK